MTLPMLGGTVVETERIAPSTISMFRLRSTEPSVTSITCALVSHPAPLSGIATHNAKISPLPPPLRCNGWRWHVAPVKDGRLDLVPNRGGAGVMELWDLRVTVESIEGRSVCGLSVGDYFELTHSSHLTMPPGRHFCIFALAAALPLLPAKQRALAEDDWLQTDALVCCPDPDERLVMRIERLELVHLDAQELT
jgi:uncharacterized repeat protein (TIGR04076 family)